MTDNVPDPKEYWQHRKKCHKHQPEPDKQVDFLIEEVDGKDTLYCVSVCVPTKLSHLKTT